MHAIINPEMLYAPRHKIDYWIQAAEYGLKLLLLIALVSALVPFSPKMPAPGLDASWALGLNQAVAQGLSFGKQILFTLGPYSSIYTKAYHPATDLMMLGGSIYLACSYWFALLLLMRGAKWYWGASFAVLLLGMIYARDSLFFSYPLLVGLAGFKMVCLPQLDYKKSQWIIALLFAPFGLLPLIKGSLLILSGAVTALTCFFFIAYSKKTLAVVSLTSTLAAMVFFWITAGQQLTHLPFYLIESLSLASQFTQAMANDGATNELLMYAATAFVLLLSLARQKNTAPGAKLFLLGLYSTFLFLSFKTGFTRHLGHAYIAGTSILIAAWLMPFLFISRLIILSLILSVYTAQFIDGHYTQISLRTNFLSTYAPVWHGLKKRISDPNWLQQNFDFSLQFLQNQLPLAPLEGSTDIYSYNQSYLIAQNTAWSPRPIFQSYSVFTAEQADKNKQHLLSKQRPDNIIFKIEPIDGRIPSLEDGASWPVLLTYYKPIYFIQDFLVLHAINGASKEGGSQQLVNTESHVLGEKVFVPQYNSQIYIALDIKPTIWGLLATFFFKPDPLKISIELNNGEKKEFKMVANMAQSDFLLSPLIENTDEFALMYTKPQLLDAKKVKSFSITASKSRTWDWRNEYLVHYKLRSALSPSH